MAEAAQHHGAKVKRVDLADLSFDPDFRQSTFTGSKPLELDLELFLSTLEWSDHAAIVAPMWWAAGGFAPVEKSTDQQRQTWLGQVREDIRADLRKRPVQTLAQASQAQSELV